MYGTGYMLLVCGVPACVVLTFLFMSDESMRLSRSEALHVGVFMISGVVIIAVTLLLAATAITKYRRRR